MIRKSWLKIKGFWQTYGGRMLFVTTVVALIFSILGLRHNNIVAGELRQAVVAADETADRRLIEPKLIRLRQHVLGHMNTSLGQETSQAPIQLPYLYYRDTIAVYEASVAQVGVTQLEILKTARQICEIDERRIEERLNCILQETQRRGGPNYPTMRVLPKDYYVFDFESPAWSPDLAGWSLVVLVLAGVSLLGRWATRVISQIMN